MPNFHKPGGAKHVTVDMITEAKATIDTYMEHVPNYNGKKYKGRGIVMVAGGVKYLTCAYVCVRMIRANGCTLPIQIWHIGAMELDAEAAALFDGMHVEFVDCMDVMEKNPCRRVGGWEMNPYAIIHSPFREVIFLDADNIPLIDVEEMFGWEAYQKYGAVFWPDYGRLCESRSIWKLLGIKYKDEPEFESGQILVDKRRCWDELNLTMCLNENSDVYYQHVWGDKETYHMAWHYLEVPYAMPPYPINRLRSTMCQHDFDGNIIFQHRNMDKFALTRRNSRIKGFAREDECFKYLKELKSRWTGSIEAPIPKTKAEKEAHLELAGRSFQYQWNGRTGRSLEFLENGNIGHGGMDMEKGWYVKERSGGVILYITGKGVTATLKREELGTWRGSWLNNEMFDVVLVLDNRPSMATSSNDTVEKALQNHKFLYSRTGFDHAEITLGANNQVIGDGSNERAWWVENIYEVPVLFIGKSVHMDPICMLQRGRDGIWRGYWTRHETMHIELIPMEK